MPKFQSFGDNSNNNNEQQHAQHEASKQQKSSNTAHTCKQPSTMTNCFFVPPRRRAGNVATSCFPHHKTMPFNTDVQISPMPL